MTPDNTPHTEETKAADPATTETAPLQPRARRGMSPIMRRILTINILALGILVAGLLYLGQYRQNLIDSEIKNLISQAEMFAAALGEGAVGGVTPMRQELVRGTANRIVIRMVESTNTRARLFHVTGHLVADSRKLALAGREVEVMVLPPINQSPGILRTAFNIYDRFISRLPGKIHLKKYEEFPIQHAQHYPEVPIAFGGEIASAVRNLDQDHLMLSVAVPVQRYKQVLGALMVTKSSHSIDEALYDVRVGILEIFLVSLTLTILLSIYLAGTIARPIHRLASAADRIRQSLNRREQLPQLKNRDDEIGDLAIALRDMTDALWDRMDAIEQFAADVSHEIKNPLASLKSAVETVARVKEPEQQRKLMSIIQEDVERLDRLISDISDASRLDAELSRTLIEPVNIAKMLETLVDVHTSTSGPDAPEITLDINSGQVDTLIADAMEDRLAQVFANLIGNALTFSPKGSTIKLTARRTNTEIYGDTIIVSFADTGPGIPSGKEAAVFQRFYSERPHDEKFGTHYGLGLSISKQIIEAYGGDIKAENILDSNGNTAGALFTVCLPAG